MSYQLEQEVRRIASMEISVSPYVMGLQNEITALKERIDKMEKCCVCVKMNTPLQTDMAV